MTSSGVVLTGLAPNTTYHYRFVAESSGGGPVYGVDPDGAGPKEANFAEGLEGTFTTFTTIHPPDSCPANQIFRTGPSAALPDCRAYEMVSPSTRATATSFRGSTSPAGKPTEPGRRQRRSAR